MAKASGIISTFIVFGGIPFWLSSKFANGVLRAILNVLMSAGIMVFLMSLALFVSWGVRYRTHEPTP